MRTSAMKYHEGQRFVVDSASSIVPASKMRASSTATGFSIGTGKPNHSVGRPKKFFTEAPWPVLSFQAYFKDAVHESPLENFRIHKCEIFYYTEDDSIEVQHE